MPKIKYTPLFTPEALQTRLMNLSEAINKAIQPLRCLRDCGATEIADQEAQYVQEMRGFVELVRLMETEDLPNAINSVNKAFLEVEEVELESTRDDDEHPWLDEMPDGYFDTTVFPGETCPFCSLKYFPELKENDEEEERIINWSYPLPDLPDNDQAPDFSD